MNEKIDKAIENAVAMIRTNCKPDEALKFSQSALNLAHVKSVLGAVASEGKGRGQKGGGA